MYDLTYLLLHCLNHWKMLENKRWLARMCQLTRWTKREGYITAMFLLSATPCPTTTPLLYLADLFSNQFSRWDSSLLSSIELPISDNEETIAGSSGGAAFLILPSAGKPAEIFRGIGMIAKVVSDSTGIIWWLRKPNHYKSVWFHRQKTFKYGLNLHDKSLQDCVKEGKNKETASI